MPAAASFEDIYLTSSSSSPAASSLGSSASLPGCSGGAASSYRHLPDYMAVHHLGSLGSDTSKQLKDKQQQQQVASDADHISYGGQLKQQQQAATAASCHQHPLRANCLNRANTRQLKTYQQQQQQQQAANDVFWPSSQLGRRQSYDNNASSSTTTTHQQLNQLPTEYSNDYYYYGIEDLDDMENIGQHTNQPAGSHTSQFDDDNQFDCIHNHSSKASAFLSTTMTPSTHQHYLTLEELKMAHSSCWLCGCNWQQDHVSLDCQECGGYALTRPCLKCDGKCKQIWERNITHTHDHHRASWIGQCKLSQKSPSPQSSSSLSLSLAPASSTKMAPAPMGCSDTEIGKPSGRQPGQVEPLGPGGNQLQKPPLASSCCSSQASSAASSDCE